MVNEADKPAIMEHTLILTLFIKKDNKQIYHYKLINNVKEINRGKMTENILVMGEQEWGGIRTINLIALSLRPPLYPDNEIKQN